MKTTLKVIVIAAAFAVGGQFGIVAGLGTLCAGALVLSPVAQLAFGAIDIKPSTVFGAGYSLASHAISMNTNDASSDKTLPQLTDAEANATTGDARAVLFAICEMAYQWFVGLAKADQPKKLLIGRSVVNQRDGTIKNVYTLTFTVTPPTGEYTIPAES